MKKLLLLFSLSSQMNISHAQNVGIGTTNPLARLHVTDSSVVFTALDLVPDVPGNPPVSGPGRRMMWYADKAAFRAGYAGSTDWNKDNIGNYSFATGLLSKAPGAGSAAFGSYTEAHGDYSTAIGYFNRTYGESSIAMGSNNVASGYISTAIGFLTRASGELSIAMGQGVTARSALSLAIGRYNDSIASASKIGWVATDPLLYVGNGSDDGNRHNAMMVLKNGNVGIGLNAPAARLHVADSSVVFTASDLIPDVPGNPPVSGAGRRMMWYADKAAFRAGHVDGSQWDRDNIGNYSIAMGFKNTASGNYSTAIGVVTTASQPYSTAMGYITTASGSGSTAMGSETIASGSSSTAMGYATSASGFGSTAMGESTTAGSSNSLAIGRYNDSIAGANKTAWIATDPLFYIGNGSDANNRHNAMTVLKNGKMGIGISAPATKLHITEGTDASLVATSGYMVTGNTGSTNLVFDDNEIIARNNGANGPLYLQNEGGALIVGGTASKPGGGTWDVPSDARLKQNIKPYSDGLQQLLQISPVFFQYNQLSGYKTDKEYIGVVAQELDPIAPYMVAKDDKGFLKVDNSSMTYMLINAVKEQQQTIEQLKKENATLIYRIEKLESKK